MFEDLTFRNAQTAIYSGKPGSVGITVRRCRIDDVVNGINTQSENSRNWYIADNEIVGINPTWYPRPEAYMSPAHTGVNVYGQGHVVCYNRITRFSDALAIANFGPPVDDVEKHCVAIDFYNNDLSWAQDDTIEDRLRLPQRARLSQSLLQHPHRPCPRSPSTAARSI